jgi:hypothetical protein
MVIVLPGVDDDFPDARLAKGTADWSQLDELGSGADDDD